MDDYGEIMMMMMTGTTGLKDEYKSGTAGKWSRTTAHAAEATGDRAGSLEALEV